MEIVKRNKGHLASVYLRLLKFISENDAPIRYKWVAPGSRQVTERTVSKEQADALYEQLKKMTELTSVPVEFVGKVKKVDVNQKTWRIFDEEDEKSYAGSLSETSQASLAGIVVDSQRYRFVCDERMVSTSGTGRQKKEYFLQSYDLIPHSDHHL